VNDFSVLFNGCKRMGKKLFCKSLFENFIVAVQI